MHYTPHADLAFDLDSYFSKDLKWWVRLGYAEIRIQNPLLRALLRSLISTQG